MMCFLTVKRRIQFYLLALVAKGNFLYSIDQFFTDSLASVIFVDDEFIHNANAAGLPKIIFQREGTKSNNTILLYAHNQMLRLRGKRMLVNGLKRSVVQFQAGP
jgi:hypothetical protein